MDAEQDDTTDVCERMQTEWFRARAEWFDGAAWSDGPLLWTDGPDGLNLMFPAAIEPDALRRGVGQARERGRELLCAWISNTTDASPLAAAGFERGWAPWWMSAPIDALLPPADPRVHLGVTSGDVADEQSRDDYGRMLDLARFEPDRAFYATARVDGALAGHAWSFVVGDTAGIFDLDVWPPYRRRGLGAAMLHAVCARAREAGARRVVLSATPQGAVIYRAQGFSHFGGAATWWLQLD